MFRRIPQLTAFRHYFAVLSTTDEIGGLSATNSVEIDAFLNEEAIPSAFPYVIPTAVRVNHLLEAILT